MTLLQLQYYVTVCKYESLTRAGRELRISQPAISAAIRELESECGFALFEHRPNSIILTEQGRAFRKEAEHVLRSYQQLQSNAELIAQGKTVIRIGVAPMGASLVFPRLRKGFDLAFPDIRLETVEDSTESLYQKIDTGEIDFAVTVSIAPPNKEDYRSIKLENSRLLLCVHRNDPIATQPLDSLTQVGDTPLIMLSDHYSQTKYLKRLFRQAYYTPNVIQYTSQVFTILQYIRENAAAGFLSEDIAAREDTLASFALREVDEASITMIWRADVQIFPAMVSFIDYVRTKTQSVG